MWVLFAAVRRSLVADRVIRCAAKRLVAIGRIADFAAQPAHVYEFTP